MTFAITRDGGSTVDISSLPAHTYHLGGLPGLFLLRTTCLPDHHSCQPFSISQFYRHPPPLGTFGYHAGATTLPPLGYLPFPDMAALYTAWHLPHLHLGQGCYKFSYLHTYMPRTALQDCRLPTVPYTRATALHPSWVLTWASSTPSLCHLLPPHPRVPHCLYPQV